MDNRLYNVKPLKCCEPDEKPSKCHGLYEIVNNIVKENIKDKQNKLIAGDNITIKDDVISATGGGGIIELLLTDWDLTDESAIDYIKNKPTNVSLFVNDAGYLTEHLDISGKQDKLTAGDRITIEDNIISAQDSVASDVSYDNTRTGLSAANVQDAIDEMADTNLYETVVLTVGSADSSFNPVGQTITVTLEDGSATQYTVPMSRQITFIVQRGMRYTISGTSTDDYRVLPISVKAAIPTRYLTMRYIPIATGVFILQKDGNYYLREEYDAETMAEDAVGVLVLTSALITAGFGIVLHKGETVSITKNECAPSVNGWNNMTMLDSLLQSQRCANVAPTKYPSCVNALTRSIEVAGNMLIGCIPTYAAGKLLYANEANINMAMTVIGGSAKSMNNLITCTGHRPSANWALYYWSGSSRDGLSNDRTLTVYQYPLS